MEETEKFTELQSDEDCVVMEDGGPGRPEKGLPQLRGTGELVEGALELQLEDVHSGVGLRTRWEKGLSRQRE